MKGVSEPIRRLLSGLGIRGEFRPPPSSWQILMKVRDPMQPDEKSNVVYRIPCKVVLQQMYECSKLRSVPTTFGGLCTPSNLLCYALEINAHMRIRTVLACTCNMATSSAGSSGSGASCSDSGSRSRSDVWKFFEKKKEIKKAKCTLRGKELAFHGGTSNLREHLLKVHPLLYQKPQRGDIDTFFKPKQCSEARAKEITERVARMLALDLKPLRTVECDGFWDLMAYLEPSCKVPSQTHIATVLHHKHELGKEQL